MEGWKDSVSVQFGGWTLQSEGMAGTTAPRQHGKSLIQEQEGA